MPTGLSACVFRLIKNLEKGPKGNQGKDYQANNEESSRIPHHFFDHGNGAGTMLGVASQTG
jgi:hypothetical protein